MTKNFIISEISRTAPVAGNTNANPLVPCEAALFPINSPKLYVHLVTLSIHLSFRKPESRIQKSSFME